MATTITHLRSLPATEARRERVIDDLRRMPSPARLSARQRGHHLGSPGPVTKAVGISCLAGNGTVAATSAADRGGCGRVPGMTGILGCAAH
jgi:hypothetical protein